MSEPVLPSGDEFLARFKDLERRLGDLERAAKMPNTSQRGGTFALLDANGRNVIYFGEYNRSGGDPAYGFLGVIPDGAGPGSNPTVLEIDDDGLEAPWLDIPFAVASIFVDVTSGTFVDVWVGHAALVVARAVLVDVVVTVDAATTGEVRIVAGSRTSSAVTCPASSQTDQSFAMLLADDTIGSGPLAVKVQARRTAGAGNVHVYAPTAMAQAGNDGSTATVTGL